MGHGCVTANVSSAGKVPIAITSLITSLISGVLYSISASICSAARISAPHVSMQQFEFTFLAAGADGFAFFKVHPVP
jgi:hypothetical protein